MELQFFTLNTTQQWGKKIEDHLEITMGLHEERNFEDGEHKSRPLENVRDRDVFVLQSLYSDAEQSVNDKICRLLFFIGALKDASARQVTAVIPYFAYARKDRKTKTRDPVTMKYMAQLLEAAGADRIITMDIHNLAAFQNAFRIPTEHLEARVLFAPYFSLHLKNEEIVIVSPDAGGVKRAEQFQKTLSGLMHKKIGLAFLEKQRSEGIVEGGEKIIGEVKDKVAIIIDDIISSGKTIELGVKALKDQGASRIFICASHGILTKESNKVLANPLIEKVLITDSIPPRNLDQNIIQEKIVILDSTRLFARAMKRVQAGDSVVDLLEHYPEAIQELALLS